MESDDDDDDDDDDDLISDVFTCCVWNCDMGKINVPDKIVWKPEKKEKI